MKFSSPPTPHHTRGRTQLTARARALCRAQITDRDGSADCYDRGGSDGDCDA